MAEERDGCFSWLISLKKSCNERWARFRNSLRQRYYARRGKTLNPETLLNETGTADMVIEKIPHKSNKIVPQHTSPRTVVKDDAFVAENTTLATNKAENDIDKYVEEYVSGIITKAADDIRQESLHNTATVIVKPAADDISLSSSIISQIADIAITESLTNVVLEADINHSVVQNIKTLRELKEAFGIYGSDDTDDGLPAVSD